MIQNSNITANSGTCKNKSLIELNITDYHAVQQSEFETLKHSIGENIELCVVINGSGIHRVMNKSDECQVGDMYIIGSGVSHGYYACDGVHFPTVLSVRFDPKSVLSGKYADPTRPQFCYGIFRDNVPISYALLNSHSITEITNICKSLKDELENSSLENFEAARSYLILLLITVARYINLADTVLPSYSKEWSIVSAAIREIFNRCSDVDMTLESIATTLYVSKSHLSRLFQKVVGEPFLDYVRKVRIKKACNLLHYTTMTNEEIVGKCGLKDIPTFYRQFKSVTGMTPHQYRISQNSNYRSDSVIKEQVLNELSDCLQNGRLSQSGELLKKALDSGISATEILNNGLLVGMNIVADRFKNNEVFVPTVLAAAKVMNSGIEILKPYLVNEKMKYIGKVCIGTVRGDLHDIGKNLVKIMMQSKGLEVIDLGVDVAPQEFINTAIEQRCQVICCSALLTTTMGIMREVVECAKEAGIRDTVKILIGGAPVTEEFCREIGADMFTPDAVSAAEAAIQFCR